MLGHSDAPERRDRQYKAVRKCLLTSAEVSFVGLFIAENMSLMSKSSFDVHMNQRSAMLTVKVYVDATSRNRNLSISIAVEPISLKEEYMEWGPEYIFHSSRRFSASVVH
jgi:hypothetical protein